MTIEEAITCEREKAEEQRYYANFEKGSMYQACLRRAEKHDQLAGWLEELSRRRVEELFRKTNEKAIIDKAIDEFVKKLKEHGFTCNFDWEYYDEIAEQLRAGASDGNV